MATLPPPPRRAGREPSPRRRPLTLERILDAALAILDREGLNGVTMRAVAEALGTGGASLYAHVTGKDALVELLLDRIYAEVELPPAADTAPWDEQVKDIARAVRGVLVAHRDIARASLGTIPTQPNALAITERLITLMREGGLGDQVIAYGLDLLALYATATAYEESLYIRDGLTEQDFERWRGEMTSYMASLPADRFPGIVALAGPLTAGTMEGDERFTFGLDVLVAGLRAHSDAG